MRPCGGALKDRRVLGSTLPGAARGSARGVEQGLHRCLSLTRLCVADDVEADAVTRGKLANLPQVGLDHHQRAYKSAERRSVRSQNNRHITGKIDAADRIGVVVNVRWV